MCIRDRNFVSAQTAVIEPASVQIPWGQTVEEPVATRTGYEVTGWYTEPALEHLFDFTKPVYESITLYAKWGVKHFTVNFWDGETLLYTPLVRYNARVEPVSYTHLGLHVRFRIWLDAGGDLYHRR